MAPADYKVKFKELKSRVGIDDVAYSLGYRCENNTGEDGKCGLFINGVIGNRKMADVEVAELLERRSILLDGFATK